MHIIQYYTLKTEMIGELDGNYASQVICGR
jgi:hypothetical protein